MVAAVTKPMPGWRATLNRVGAFVLAFLLVMVLAGAAFRVFGMPRYPGLSNVAHAGGAVNGFTYVNGLAAFDAAYGRGFRRFEVDFRRTSDGVIVCGHDWNHFGGIAPTLSEFLELRFQLRYPGCTLDEVVQWFRGHPDAVLISDAKEDVNLVNSTLRQAIDHQLIPQVFTFKEAQVMGSDGVHPVIVALYKIDGFAQRYALVVDLSRTGVRIAGVSMQDTDVMAGLGLWSKLWLGAPVYAYTVNSCGTVHNLDLLGVDAVYTDILGAHDCEDDS